MNTLTINLPDSIDPAVARWELVRLLYDKGELTLEEAAPLVDLTPTYFKIRLQRPFDLSAHKLRNELLASATSFDRQKFDQLIDQLNIQESWEDLVAQIGK